VKIYISLLILFLSLEAFANAKVHLKFTAEKIKQGSIVDAVIGLNSETTQKIQYGQLKGQTLGEAFYIYSAKPLMTKGSWDTLESEAKIIVVKIPDKQPLVHKLENNEIEITWSSVEFIPTETPKELIFGTFEVPSKIELLKWFLGLLTLGALVLGGMKISDKLKAKNGLKQKRKEIKESVLGAKEYQEVVSIWQKKPVYVKEFPHLEEPFKKLENTLFKYQFKQRQSEYEKAEVLRAYQEFIEASRGGFNGI
jgi:hypothetical protein